jgi:hypothetical protein
MAFESHLSILKPDTPLIRFSANAPFSCQTFLYRLSADKHTEPDNDNWGFFNADLPSLALSLLKEREITILVIQKSAIRSVYLPSQHQSSVEKMLFKRHQIKVMCISVKSTIFRIVE